MQPPHLSATAHAAKVALRCWVRVIVTSTSIVDVQSVRDVPLARVGAVKAGIVTLQGTRATRDSGSTGRYVSLARASCWLGLNHRIWSKHGRSPMWVRFNADQWGRAVAMRKALQQWAAMDPPRAYLDDEDGAVRVPLLLRTGVEKDAVALDAERQLRALGEMMVAGGMPVLNGAPLTD